DDSPPGYTLQESPQNARERAQALAVARAQAQQRMVARLQEVRRMAFLPRDALAQLARAGEAKGKSLKNPRTSAMARLMAQLPPEVFRQLETTGSASITVASLSPELQSLACEVAGRQHEGIDPSVVVANGVIKLAYAGTIDRPTIWARIMWGGEG